MQKEKRSNQSAGLLLYRFENNILQVLLVHPGGPFYKNKDAGSWTIPKGEFFNNEEKLAAAKREFKEETGFDAGGNFIELNFIKQKSGKIVFAFATEQHIDASKIQSNFFEMEWPPKSAKMQSFPEVDKAQWFTVDEAKEKIIAAQISFLDQLLNLLKK